MRSVSIVCCLETVRKTIQVTIQGSDLLIYHSYSRLISFKADFYTLPCRGLAREAWDVCCIDGLIVSHVIEVEIDQDHVSPAAPHT